ncbi:MAG TPA: PASTA domain-containing protein [Solirubrobacter sp.]|nr:PASTA domain-containing protein [Solirubrobacter sp.]
MDCPTCGRPNADNRDFCECGEYLRWDPTGVFAVPVQQQQQQPQAAGTQQQMPAAAVPATPEPAPVEPVLLVLRRPGAPPGEGPPQIQLAPSTPGMLQGFVRNQTRQVDSYALRVSGIPAEWVDVSPPSVDLLPYGSSSAGHESHFHMTITPPRDPSARAGLHPFRLEAVSRTTNAIAAGATGTLEILPYHELALDVRPQHRSTRRRARFAVTLTATGNAPVEAEPTARDRADELIPAFAPPTVHLEPTQPVVARLTAKPRRQHWIGRPREHQLSLTAQAGNAPPPPAQVLTVRQKAWIPFWLPPLLLAIAALIAAYVLTRPPTTTMPDLVGGTFNSGQRALARAEFTKKPEAQTERARRRSEIGRVIAQEPPAGETVNLDTQIVLTTAVSRNETKVPDLKKLDLDRVQVKLRQAKLKLGQTDGDVNQGVVVRQDPPNGDRAKQGSLVRVWFETQKAKKPKTVPTVVPTTTAQPGDTVSLAGLRTLAIADAKGVAVDPPDQDAQRLNAVAGDSDPAWLGDQIVFRRVVDGQGQLFAVDDDPAAEPQPLTDAGEDWRSPAGTAGALAAVRGDDICVRVDEFKCRTLAGVYRVTWGSEGATLVALVHAAGDKTDVVSFDAGGDDPAAWPAPTKLGTVGDARDLAVSPEGVVVISNTHGLEQVGGGRILPDIEEACGIEFLDATRLAVAAGACGGDAQIRLADTQNGAIRALSGDRGEYFAFKG